MSKDEIIARVTAKIIDSDVLNLLDGESLDERETRGLVAGKIAKLVADELHDDS